jgi:RNA polymerase sigma-70 factor (ECF subfamily)
MLTYFRGLKYKDVADILEIPVGTVKSRLHAAVTKLAEDWTGEEEVSREPKASVS